MTPTKYLSLKEAAKAFPSIEGRHPHVSAVWRMARKGLLSRNGQRIRLDHCRVGRRVCIPLGAVERFLAELTTADTAHFDAPTQRPTSAAIPPPASTALRRKQIAAAESACAARGI